MLTMEIEPVLFPKQTFWFVVLIIEIAEEFGKFKVLGYDSLALNRAKLTKLKTFCV